MQMLMEQMCKWSFHLLLLLLNNSVEQFLRKRLYFKRRKKYIISFITVNVPFFRKKKQNERTRQTMTERDAAFVYIHTGITLRLTQFATLLAMQVIT